MSICDDCIHNDVCGLEDNHEEGIISCADRMPKNVLDEIRTEIAEQHNDCLVTEYYDAAYGLELALGIIDKYKGETE